VIDLHIKSDKIESVLRPGKTSGLGKFQEQVCITDDIRQRRFTHGPW
jgi:hypothetical protein